MLIIWKIRYIDRSDRRFKDRFVYLRTATLDPTTRADIERITDLSSWKAEREILKYRHLFRESPSKNDRSVFAFRTVNLKDYYEDETGAVITPAEMGAIPKG